MALAKTVGAQEGHNASVRPPVAVGGGLAGWQQQQIARYVETRLSESIPLATLEEQARLSPYHFARKHSFRVPRIAIICSAASSRPSGSKASITEIAPQVGFHETSSFTAAFRKLSDHSPSDYRRSPDGVAAAAGAGAGRS
jgi:AraC family transcriptional regulator